MNSIIDKITQAICDFLISVIEGSLSTMFNDVNEKVATIAADVGQTPQGWNASIFSLIQNISQTVILPIAGLIIAFVLCYELITMITEKNNMHISYKPLWHTLLERDMRKEDLRLAAGMTTNMLAYMIKERKHISMNTLARICETLNCENTDVIELVPDEPASTGGKEHERIETKNKRKRN